MKDQFILPRYDEKSKLLSSEKSVRKARRMKLKLLRWFKRMNAERIERFRIN